ncbi:MAG: tripartite tricarboxylate transporter TctB family protein [Pseudomonadota bacterium]
MQVDRENVIAGTAVLGLAAVMASQVLPGQFDGVALARNPMTFPRFLLLLFAAGGLALLLKGLFAGRPGARPWTSMRWWRVLALLVLVSVYLAVFADVGFLMATAVFLPVVMVMLGYRNILVIALVTAVVVPGLWYVFAEAFSIRPPGIGLDDIIRSIKGPS